MDKNYFLNIINFKKNLGFFLSLKGVFLICVVCLSLIINGLFIYKPKILDRYLSFAHKEKEHYLSRLEENFIDKTSNIRVVKTKRENKIFLEFWVKNPDNSFTRQDTLEMTGNREAYFDFWAETISLVALDYDGDGQLDIVAPTFDSFLKPHLNLVVYNKQTQQFEKKPNLKTYPSVKDREI